MGTIYTFTFSICFRVVVYICMRIQNTLCKVLALNQIRRNFMTFVLQVVLLYWLHKSKIFNLLAHQ